MQLDKNLPWEKLAEPQTDFSDLEMIWYVADRLYQYQKPLVDSDVTMFGGRVAIKLFDDGVTRSTSNYTEYPKDKFLTGNKVQLLEDTLRLTPYAEHVARFLDAYHPKINEKHDEYHSIAALGCQCGPVKKPADGSIEVGSSYSNPVTAGDGIIHEVWHQRLHALGIDFETHAGLFFTNADTEVYDSPIRKDKLRPMPAVIQAQYSYIGVTEYYKTLIDKLFDSETPTPTDPPNNNNINVSALDSWLSLSAHNVYRIREGVDTINANIKPTSDIGERFLLGYMNYANRVITEAIDQLKRYEMLFDKTYDWGAR